MTEVQSRQNAVLRHLARLLREKKYRQSEGQFALEGDKLLYEAIGSAAVPLQVLVRASARERLAPLLQQAEAAGATLYYARDDIFDSAFAVNAPQNILFSCKTQLRPLPAAPKQLLLLEGIQDPGNVGTIIRSAEAFGIDGVIFCEGCADVFSPKVVRATMGGIFRLPMAEMGALQASEFVKKQGLPLFGAALSADSLPLSEASLARAAVLIGSEGQGLRPETLARCDGLIKIPMRGRAESLNAAVAAGLILYEMQCKSE